MEQKVVEELKSIMGDHWVVTEIDSLRDYLVDETPELIRPEPGVDSVLVKPVHPGEISDILKYANREHISVIPRGGGTGLCATATDPRPSIILSLERMNRILEVDEGNLAVRPLK